MAVCLTWAAWVVWAEWAASKPVYFLTTADPGLVPGSHGLSSVLHGTQPFCYGFDTKKPKSCTSTFGLFFTSGLDPARRLRSVSHDTRGIDHFLPAGKFFRLELLELFGCVAHYFKADAQKIRLDRRVVDGFDDTIAKLVTDVGG